MIDFVKLNNICKKYNNKLHLVFTESQNDYFENSGLLTKFSAILNSGRYYVSNMSNYDENLIQYTDDKQIFSKPLSIENFEKILKYTAFS